MNISRFHGIKWLCVICLTLMFSCQTASHHHGYEDGRILDAAEDFFIYLEKGSYERSWELLSEESRKTIVKDVYRASRSGGIDIKKEDILKDFNSSGIMFNRYWNAFMNNFDPDIVLEERVWEFESTGADRAVILLRGKGLTRLRMYKESGLWKVGLTETFWARRPGRIKKFLNALFMN